MKSPLAVLVALVSCGLAAPWASPTAGSHRLRLPQSDRARLLRDSRQLVLVVTADWDSVAGTLRRFERSTRGASWTPVAAPIPVVVGRSGLGWGIGPIEGEAPPRTGPIKQEGDGKSPAGVFLLDRTFGQSPQPLAGSAMQYLPLGDDVECVDDVRSAHYNQLVTKRGVQQADWTSSEKMWAEPLYRWGIEVAHNVPVKAGAGSCIFMHIWRGPDKGTAGCTAMDESKLIETITWLDSAKTPTLVQLPRREYERLKVAWGLP